MRNFNHPKSGTTLRTLIATETEPVTCLPIIIIRGVTDGLTLLVTAGVVGPQGIVVTLQSPSGPREIALGA
jgi:hypothetical protein